MRYLIRHCLPPRALAYYDSCLTARIVWRTLLAWHIAAWIALALMAL